MQGKIPIQVVLHMSGERLEQDVALVVYSVLLVTLTFKCQKIFLTLKQKIIRFRIKTDSVGKCRIQFSQQIIFFLKRCCAAHSDS
jgi:hypothetical protein